MFLRFYCVTGAWSALLAMKDPIHGALTCAVWLPTLRIAHEIAVGDGHPSDWGPA